MSAPFVVEMVVAAALLFGVPASGMDRGLVVAGWYGCWWKPIGKPICPLPEGQTKEDWDWLLDGSDGPEPAAGVNKRKARPATNLDQGLLDPLRLLAARPPLHELKPT